MPPPRPRSNGAATGAYLLAIVALFLAVAAGAAAAYAYKIAQEARDAVAAPSVTQTVTSPPSTPAPSTTTASPAPTQPSGPVFTPEFERAERPVPRPSGCNAAYVDVDTLGVGNQAGHEFYLALRPCDDTPNELVVRVDRTSGRSVSAANPTAEACGSLVAGTPTSELVLDVAPGLTFCLLTNRNDATTQSLPQRLAIVEVLTVSQTQVVLAISTYRVD
jgi:hypothetical protein